MADSYRPLSRHSVKIRPESSTLMHTMPHMDASIHNEFGEIGVFETTVRPKSRRLASRGEGVTRPTSGYKTRNHDEKFARGIDPGAAESQAGVDRPHTAHRRRQSHISESQSGASTSDETVTMRPKSSYGKRRKSVVSATPDQAEVIERPQTRRDRRTSHKYSARPPSPTDPSAMLQRERTFYDAEISSRPADLPVERPPTRCETTSWSTEASVLHSSTPPPTTPRNTRDPAERPRTSRGRRHTTNQNSNISSQAQSSETQPSTEPNPPTGTDRPMTSRGRRKNQHVIDLSEDVHGPQPPTAPANILVIDNRQPEATRERRRNQYNIDLSYMNPGADEQLVKHSPSPPPRPPSSRRPRSSWRQRTAHPPPSPSDVDRQTVGTPLGQSSRPPSSCLNRYTPLPAIGAAGRETPTANPIHIPHGSPFDVTSRGYDANVCVLADDTRRLTLSDSDHAKNKTMQVDCTKTSPDFSSSTRAGPAFSPLTRSIVLPPEPAEDEERLTLAIKLPDGTRTQHAFRPTEEMRLVMNFAELSSQLDFSYCELVCDAPRKVFRDLAQTIEESGLQNRTVLHVQITDDP